MKRRMGSESKQTRGQDAENFAATFLSGQGAEIVARNVSGRHGEIDLVVRHDNYLVFVEVRLRNHRGFADGAESVDARKQRKLIATAAQYLQRHYRDRPPSCRFDVLALTGGLKGDTSYSAEWIKDAFRPDF